MSDGIPYLESFVVFSAAVTVWVLYLDVRQLRKNKETVLPAELKGIIDEERFAKSQVYQADKRVFSMFNSVLHFFVQCVEVIYAWPWAWKVAGDMVGTNEYYRSIAWVLITHVINYPIDIPVELYRAFVLEERHGFNKMTLSLFITDQLKSFGLAAVFIALLVPIVIFVVHWGGEHFYIYIWAVAQLLIFVFMFVYPSFIMPLFNKYESLKDATLRSEIESLAKSLLFPLTKLFQVDGSKRSSHSNAFMFGFWRNKRIVLFDTLLESKAELDLSTGLPLGFEPDFATGKLVVKSLSAEGTAVGKWNEVHHGRLDEIKGGDTILAVKGESGDKMREEFEKTVTEKGTLILTLERKPYATEEILAILCHEIGHWFHAHVLRTLVITSVHAFILFRLYAFVMHSSSMFEAFGFSAGDSGVVIGLAIFMLIFSPVETVVGMGMIVMSRKNEFQADDFAVKQGRGQPLGSGLQKLVVDNLGDVNPDPWFSWFHHSHPTLLERLRNIREKESLRKKGE